MTAFDSKSKTSFEFVDDLDKVFNVHDNTGKVRQVSTQYLQLLHPTD